MPWSYLGGLEGMPLLVGLAVVNSGKTSYPKGVFSGALISADFIRLFPQTKHANISGITSSCFSLGAFFGCIASFTAGDQFGRRKTVWLGLSMNVVGAILQITAFHLPQMIVGRIINGFGMGVISSTCPVFMAETSPFRLRGKLVVLGSVCNTIGFCIANWINYGLYANNGPEQWRFPLGFQLIFPLIVAVILPWVVESPRWLLLKNRHEDALKALAKLYGKSHALDDQDLNDELSSICRSIDEERKNRAPTKDVLLFRDSNQNMRRLLLSCGTQLMQQFTGVNAMSYYLPTLLIQSVGVSSAYARLLTAANATLYLGAALLCIFLIDLVGRRKLLLYGSLATGCCYLVAAITLKEALIHPDAKKTLGAVTTSMFFLYYFTYGTSFAKVPWVFNSEINSLGWRARGAAAATATNWIGGFIVVQFTKTGVNNLGWGFYLLFACFCFSFFPIVYLLYPETCRRTLEDMDEIFKERRGAFVFSHPVLTQRQRPQAFIEAERRRIEAASDSEEAGARAPRGLLAV
ncbi:general substrate transporter [Coniochaeta ligniaria NRRL 30616]|uniref:General substrate transporter n=1 Tax=Coniochaeta ligniaria NRRL 30616 TaxID=1408157 RepID=A0A1J7IX64_9PEZI|nr:general substrate transporter [Coniochaeta ligniaria NRRL 30616]